MYLAGKRKYAGELCVTCLSSELTVQEFITAHLFCDTGGVI